MHSELAESLAVQLDICCLESCYEFAVGRTIVAGTGVDAGVPERASCALFVAAITVGELQ